MSTVGIPADTDRTAAPASAHTTRAGRRRGRLERPWIGYLFILPAALAYGVFLLYPLGRAVVISFYRWDGLTPGVWVGLDNYRTVLTDADMHAAFGHAFALIFFYAVLPLAIGLVLAALLTRSQVRGIGLFRTIVFLPQVLALVVVAVAWKRIYAPDGALNRVLTAVGLEGWTRAWLGDFTWTLPAVGLIGTWVSTGLVTVLLMSGMARIPKDLYEAATIDGAGPVRQFFAITLPAVRPEITVALTLTIIAAMKTFDLVYVTTSGGPGNATAVPSYEVYNHAFALGEVGVATALAVVLTALILVINVVVNKIGEVDE